MGFYPRGAYVYNKKSQGFGVVVRHCKFGKSLVEIKPHDEVRNTTHYKRKDMVIWKWDDLMDAQEAVDRWILRPIARPIPAWLFGVLGKRGLEAIRPSIKYTKGQM